jgi:hypothetical protein
MANGWYLLIHSLPPKPLYLRAKIRQRLARVGALAVKNSVYVLPRSEECLEDLQWIAEEARAGGGEAVVCEAGFIDGIDEETLAARFRRERSADYAALAAEARAVAGATREDGETAAALSRLAARLADVAAIDFFQAPGREEVEKMIRSVEKNLHRTEHRGRTGVPLKGLRASGRTWTTRRGVKVDRMASAWLIRRFIDPKARFRFVDPGEEKVTGELRFDIAGGDFTHEGGLCTFEILRARFGLDEAALKPIAEIVHDIDLKDGRYGRPEAAGIKRLIDGLVAALDADEDRLARSAALFDGLHSSFGGKAPPQPGPARKRRRR